MIYMWICLLSHIPHHVIIKQSNIIYGLVRSHIILLRIRNHYQSLCITIPGRDGFAANYNPTLSSWTTLLTIVNLHTLSSFNYHPRSIWWHVACAKPSKNIRRLPLSSSTGKAIATLCHVICNIRLRFYHVTSHHITSRHHRIPCPSDGLSEKSESPILPPNSSCSACPQNIDPLVVSSPSFCFFLFLFFSVFSFVLFLFVHVFYSVPPPPLHRDSHGKHLGF